MCSDPMGLLLPRAGKVKGFPTTKKQSSSFFVVSIRRSPKRAQEGVRRERKKTLRGVARLLCYSNSGHVGAPGSRESGTGAALAMLPGKGVSGESRTQQAWGSCLTST